MLAGPLASIVNSSVRESFVPDIWKSADVLPLPKTSPPKIIEKDLRPISLTPAVSKACMEHFVYQWIWECIEDKIDPLQFGGKKGSSTVYALIQLLHEWFTATDAQKTVVDIVLIDFAKAFDHLNHNIIIKKLVDMDVPPILTQWVATFLHNRQQRVKFGSTTSSWIHMKGGVPQGTKLGCPLFLVMINDLKTKNPTTKFVDDTTLHETKPVVGPGLLQKSLNMVTDWASDNNMSLNATKTKHLPVNFTKDVEASQDLYIEGVYIEKQKVVKLLGVYIQSDLKWNTHVDSIVTKASQRLRIISILKRSGFAEADLLVTFHSRIRSILEYACQVWHPGLTSNLVHDIERVQIRAMFIIRPHLTYCEALDTFGLTTLDERRKLLCKNTFDKINQPGNILHHLLPSVRENIHNLRHFKKRENIRTRVNRTDGSYINYCIATFGQ